MQIPILMYHSVSDEVTPARRLWTISPSTFALQIEYLKSQAYLPLNVSGLISLIKNNRQLPEKPVVITFDDGLADFFSGALPVLNKHGFPATLYISTAYVNQTGRWLASHGESTDPMLSWSQIQEISDCGIECGSHGHAHIQLDILPAKKMREEVQISKELLEQHLQKSVESFAYPYGLSSPTLRKIVQQAGFTSGCAVKHSMMTLEDDRYALGRISITSEVSLDGFQDFLMGKGLRKSYNNEPLRTKVYRIIRRIRSGLKIEK